MIKISRISSPLKDKIKNIDTCSQLDGDGVFEGKYATSGTIVLKNKFIGSLKADQTIIDNDGIFEGELKTEELIISGFVNGRVDADNIIIMENGKIVLEGTSKELSNNEDVKEFYLGGAKGERRSFKNLKSYKRRKRWL